MRIERRDVLLPVPEFLIKDIKGLTCIYFVVFVTNSSNFFSSRAILSWVAGGAGAEGLPL
jgi:hypothetical protein